MIRQCQLKGLKRSTEFFIHKINVTVKEKICNLTEDFKDNINSKAVDGTYRVHSKLCRSLLRTQLTDSKAHYTG